MDKITHEVRMAQWKSIIAECLSRPEGQSTKQWLAEKGIHEKTYYYWQRKIRQEAYALIIFSSSHMVALKGAAQRSI